MTVRSGRKCSALLMTPNRSGCLLKMLLESSRWNSTVCFLTWKASATPHGRLLFRLVPSMPDTAETEYGLWPTPTKQDGENNAGPSQWNRNTPPLNVRVKMYPTMDVGSADNRSRLGGSLNPEWVEWLMGYPIGHTALVDSETQSSRKSRLKSSKR